MADFKEAHLLLENAEFSSNPKKYLHKNQNENDLTLGGIYSKYHQLDINWHFVKGVLSLCNGDIQRASVMLYADEETRKNVFIFFREKFWYKMKLDEIQSQKIANEIYLSGVHIGITNAIKLAQETVMVKVDGIIGKMTIKALNNFDEDGFCRHFTMLEKKNYDRIIDRKPELEYARAGFIARSEIVS